MRRSGRFCNHTFHCFKLAWLLKTADLTWQNPHTELDRIASLRYLNTKARFRCQWCCLRTFLGALGRSHPFPASPHIQDVVSFVVLPLESPFTRIHESLECFSLFSSVFCCSRVYFVVRGSSTRSPLLSWCPTCPSSSSHTFKTQFLSGFRTKCLFHLLLRQAQALPWP